MQKYTPKYGSFIKRYTIIINFPSIKHEYLTFGRNKTLREFLLNELIKINLSYKETFLEDNGKFYYIFLVHREFLFQEERRTSDNIGPSLKDPDDLTNKLKRHLKDIKFAIKYYEINNNYIQIGDTRFNFLNGDLDIFRDAEWTREDTVMLLKNILESYGSTNVRATNDSTPPYFDDIITFMDEVLRSKKTLKL